MVKASTKFVTAIINMFFDLVTISLLYDKLVAFQFIIFTFHLQR